MKRSNDPPVQGACPRTLAWVISLLVGLHMLAVVAEPLRFFSQSDFQSGPEFAALRRWTAPYVEWLYLDHGYFFFAPNPGPSHLVAVDRAGEPPPPLVARPSDEGVLIDQFAYVFPDRNRQWPRLLYHRYFMLSEFYNNRFAPDRLLEEDRGDPDFVARWERDRAFYVRLGESIERSMEKTLGSTEPLRLRRLERDLPSPDQVLKNGWQLDDPRGLYVLPEGPPDMVAPKGGEAVPP
ncbi:MAG: hypothetical protein MUF23_18600 [Pirellula sp.]|nr:hypothetical protein [Pirellula sp.]